MINHRLRKCVLAAAFAGLGAGSGIAIAENVELGTITVKGEGMRDADRSFTINTISQETISGQRWENPLGIFLEAPGVEVRAIQSGSVADFITVRGMGNGGHGGDLGLSLDGVSLNEAEGHSDGYADTNVIIPLEISNFSVYKGPVSPLYGNFARAGVMAVETRKGGEYTDVHLTGGSYGTYDGQVAFGRNVDMPFGPLQLNGAVQGYESEGWKDNGRFTKMNAALRGSYMLGDRSELALSLRGHGARSQGVGNISADQFDSGWSGRRAQSPFAATQFDGADKDYSSQRIDFNHLFNDNLKLLTWYYQTKMFLVRWESPTPGPDPVPLPDEMASPGDHQIERSHDRSAQALGASLNGSHEIAGIPSSWVFGAEYYDEETFESQYRTYARNRAIFVNGAFVPEYRDRARDFETTTTSAFGQIDLDINRYFKPTLGFRYDDIDHTGTANNNPLDNLTDYDVSHSAFTPKIGVRSSVHDRWELRANYSEGFATPSINDRAATADNDPIKFTQVELGINGAPTDELYVDLVYFQLNTSDDIQAVTGQPGVFENSGETDRSGIEGEIRYFPSAVPNLELSTGFGFFDTEIKTGGNSGNELRRVPKHVANLTASYSPPSGFGARLRVRTIGEMWLNDTNLAKYGGYDVIDASLFYTIPGSNGGYTRWYIDGMNLANEAYANAPGAGNNDTEATNYNPRPPRHVMLGVIMKM